MYCIDLKEKKGLILGIANRYSIAWSVAEVLFKAGTSLMLVTQNEKIEKKIKDLLEEKSMTSCFLTRCDLTQDDQIQTLVAEVKEKLGSLDFIIHSIAFAPLQDMKGTFLETSREGFRQTLDVSCYSLLDLARRLSSLMNEGGSIVTFTFLGGERVFPGYNIMGPAKAALNAIVRGLAVELGEKGIRVNAISAGPLKTTAAKGGIKNFEQILEVWQKRSPLKRNITQEDVAKATLFLCSDLASNITGVILPVDAGYSLVGI